MKKVNKKSNKNFILLASEKLIYFLKFVEYKILLYALSCGEKQKETNKLGLNVKFSSASNYCCK